jgi:perosamine synthetase
MQRGTGLEVGIEEQAMIKVGIIGTGIIAFEHAEAIGMTGNRMRLVAASDVSADRLSQFCNACGVTRQYADAQALIDDLEVDLVVVATPPSSHEQFVVAALDAGKYVLCEKPLAHSMASALRIAEAEARHPGKLSVSYQLRHGLPFRRLAWLIEGGWIGKIRSTSLERHGQIPHSENGSASWWGRWNVAGGGVLLTQMIHEIDLLVQLIGMPQSVVAIADTRFSKIESEDYVEASLRYADGKEVRCVASVNSGTNGGSLSVNGELGFAGLNRLGWFDGARQLEGERALNAALPLPKEPSNGRLARILTKFTGGKSKKPRTAHAELYLAIAEAISRDAPLPISAKDAMGSLELCMAVYESAITGQAVRLPLAKESSVFDGVQPRDFAARKCDRDAPSAVYIKPFVPQSKPTVTRKVIIQIKYLMALCGVSTDHIKAIVRKPPLIHGGPKVRRWPWPKRRHFDSREIRAVTQLLKKETVFGDAVIYGGREEEEYCNTFASYLGGGYADAVNAGSNALYLALRALELPPGSEVIVPPSTDAGGSMPVAMNLCIPVPSDAMPGHVNAGIDQIRAVLSDRTSAIVVAHISGLPVDMDPILALAADRGIPVVEDCAQAHGAIYKGRMVGTLGAISAFSTMYGKHHCTGGQGGVVFTRDPTLYAKAQRYADRGKAIGALVNPGNMVASLNFNQEEIGMAVGRVQLAKLPGFIACRRKTAAAIGDGLEGVDGVTLLAPPDGAQGSYLFVLLKLDSSKLTCDSAAFARSLELEGIGDVYAGYPVHPTDHPWYREAKVFGTSGMPWSLTQQQPNIFELPNARDADKWLVRLDIHENLNARDVRDLLTAIRKIASYYQVAR